ncbi:MAG: hypothetical protein N2578_01185, partial [Bdellovibrionaceae bacterium]|nr:hypothetical protein [Pseudobdellovibrionaceae bacterium]
DHPVGVLHAYTLAQELKKKHGEMILDPGCMTLRFYKMDAFAAALPTAGPFFHRPEGVGIGFETQFGALNWIPLNFKD